MAPSSSSRFGPRPAAQLVHEIADALGWPRSRPARIVAGERASGVARMVLCADEAALASIDAPADTAVLLASPPTGSDGRLGRRASDPFAGVSDDIASWRRAERVVIDAALLISGGAGGIDARIAELIGLGDARGEAPGPFRAVQRDVVKLVGYVSLAEVDAVRAAICAAGAGCIGAYDSCTWSVAGTGTFRAGPGANPTVGARGELTQVEEARLEVVVPRHLIGAVVAAYLRAHSYEEPAYDVLSMELNAVVGFGRSGVLRRSGAHVWSELGVLDPQLVAHGSVDDVPTGAACAVYSGPLGDVLEAVIAHDKLQLLVVESATDVELQLCADCGVAVLLLDRACSLAAWSDQIAGHLSRSLTLAVDASSHLRFPEPAAVEQPLDAAPAGGSDFADGTWRLHFDGGSRGNPGPAAYGWVLYAPDGSEFESDGVRIGSATNNVAEWTGLLRGVEHASARGVRSLAIRGDSELVIKQVTGVYRVKNAALKPLAQQVKSVLASFSTVDVQHVYRDANARADAVANEAMDGLR